MHSYVLGRLRHHLLAWLFVGLRFAVALGLYLFLSLLLRKEQPVYVIIAGFVVLQIIAFAWSEYSLFKRSVGSSSARPTASHKAAVARS